MTFHVLLKKDGDRGYTATVPLLPRLRVRGSTRHAAVAAAVEAIERRLAEVEVVPVEVHLPGEPRAYSPEELAFARAAAERRGEPDAPITGNPILDFAGCMAHIPDDEWEAYEEELRRIREES